MTSTHIGRRLVHETRSAWQVWQTWLHNQRTEKGRLLQEARGQAAMRLPELQYARGGRQVRGDDVKDDTTTPTPSAVQFN